MGKSSTIGLKASNGLYVLVKDHIYVLVEGPILLTLFEELLLAIIVGVHRTIMFEVMEMCLALHGLN
jgi:hypothetical protein